MFRFQLVMLLYLLPFKHGAYHLPAIVWDPDNPILQKAHWKDVVRLKDFDIVSFICAHNTILMAGRDSENTPRKLNHNLFVKEISPGIENFDGTCNTTEAKLIMNCNKPKSKVLNKKEITIHTVSASEHLPTFQNGKDYMFFATSNGTLESLNSTSTTCTMVFRFHFVTRNENRPMPSCLLLGRKEVCQETRTKSGTENTSKSTSNTGSEKTRKSTSNTDCSALAPKDLNITNVTGTTMTVTWQASERAVHCNMTYYSVCYRKTKDEPCKNILVPSSQHSVTLEHLKSASQYTVSVRVHMCDGPGHSEEITSKTDPTDAEAAPTTGRKKFSIDATSVGIGFAIGIAVALAFGIGLWFIITYRQKSKDDKEKDPQSCATKARFSHDSEPEKEVIKLNIGYRESVQGWKLPKVAEEDVSLYVSEA